ncbi:class I SAM-dependent methyltransferase [Noviherbaspirillum saxi]|uniref:Class I SAM-dependent methyltransferase n=1 Tax=Noviherbaspirillum saxi TaxID=2320863 RepID=A0A3A3FWE5_9BURK|nr:class I SAM-dependent methyltransferase [Noviherbaspirillum saxi]RJG00054.1 class I SAM-dependent methyltransferase [Noviherbaspirillum saxi]
MSRVHARPGTAPRIAILRAPAVQALIIQTFSFVLVVALALLVAPAGVEVSVAAATLLQGAAAAALSRWRRLAAWWLPIQFLFPVAVVVLLAVRLPPWIFLCAFLVLLPLYWTTFRTQVPFYPSGRATWLAVEKLLPSKSDIRMIDIGSGFGGMVMHLAEHRPSGDFQGIELAPLPWLASRLIARLRRNPARFMRGDYENLSLASYDVVFAYLSPAAMPALWHKACAEMHSGSLLLSLEFPVPGAEPQLMLHPQEGGPELYGWYM